MSRSQLRLLLAAVFVACVAVRHRPAGSWARSVGCAPSRWRHRWRAATAGRSEQRTRPPVLRAPPLPTAGTRVNSAAPRSGPGPPLLQRPGTVSLLGSGTRALHEPPPTPTQVRAKREGEALVERNDYDVYSMTDIEPLPDCKVIVVCDQG